MDTRRLVIPLTAGLCVLPPFAWTAQAHTPRLPPAVQHVEPSHAAPQSPGAHVREHQQTRLEVMARETARLKERAEKLAQDIAAVSRSGDTTEECRLLRELALSLCAAAREQEQVIARMDDLLRYHDAAPASNVARERTRDRGTDRVEQHLGAVIYSMTELMKAIESMTPVLSP
jgi:hypothetical protein